MTQQLPEPLSDRFFRVNEDSEHAFDNRLIEEDRLKSAVEWLKEELKVIGIKKGKGNLYYEFTVDELLETINEAFEDVIKK